MEPQNLSRFCGIQVLLVEDNEINQEVANDILTSVGMMVTIAGNGKDAVEMVKRSSYDIILMDIQMPVMDGYDATRAIRKDLAYSELPIIAMTTNATPSNHEKCLEVGMNDFVSKPIDTKGLLKKIKQWTTLNINNKTWAIEEKSNLKEEAFPALEGIDVESALSRLGGNQKLYRKLLTKFYLIHKYDIAEIKKAVDQDDYKTAEIITHTLKGAAGNLGAKAVYLASSNLEKQLKSFEQDQLKPLMEHLERVMVQVIDGIASIEQGAEDEDTTIQFDEVNITDIYDRLEGLMKLIEDHDMEAADYLESLIVGLKDPVWSSLFVSMSEKLEQYDFHGAKHHLSVIISKLKKEGGSKRS
ncbi:MAG: response regulator [Clostridiaceae bacterium]|nr:response regulator [Clostridiaceae bacterium]